MDEHKDEYDDLFAAYLRDLREARDEAMAWWNALLGPECSVTSTKYREVRLRWPAGPASHPRIITVFRKYFLECEKLNERTSIHFLPVRLLLDSIEGKDAALSEFMESFVFIPIGINPEGDTV